MLLHFLLCVSLFTHSIHFHRIQSYCHNALMCRLILFFICLFFVVYNFREIYLKFCTLVFMISIITISVVWFNSLFSFQRNSASPNDRDKYERTRSRSPDMHNDIHKKPKVVSIGGGWVWCSRDRIYGYRH